MNSKIGKMVKYLITNSCISLLLFLNISCKQGQVEHNNKKYIAERNLKKVDTIKKNNYKISTKGNIIEIYHQFIKKNNNSEVLGDTITLDFSNTSGAMISAYSKSKENYSVYFRIQMDEIWSDWKKMDENNEVKNPSRKVFSPMNLKNSVKKIQFKSSNLISEEVVFRIYKFKK